MLICPICKTENSDTAKVCISCGSPLSDDNKTFEFDVLQPGTKLHNDRFTVGRVLGQGGFGITYLGSDLQDKSTVAIKELFISGCKRHGSSLQFTRNVSSQNFNKVKKRFLEEGKVLEGFNHPGIVKVKSVFEENDTAYIAMEYLEGQTLQNVLEKRGALPEQEALTYVNKIADALETVHKAGLLHRDVKPDNIMICDDGRVVLIDFGTARQYTSGEAKTMTSWLTPGYAPFEQYSQKAEFNPSTDIYSLGATLYHLVTGHLPEQSTDRMIDDKLIAPGIINHNLSTGTSNAVMWALKMAPEARPQSISEFKEALAGDIPPDIVSGLHAGRASAGAVHPGGGTGTRVVDPGLLGSGAQHSSPPDTSRQKLIAGILLIGIPLVILAVVLSSSNNQRTENSNPVELFVGSIAGPTQIEEGSTEGYSIDVSGPSEIDYDWTCVPANAGTFTDETLTGASFTLDNIPSSGDLTISYTANTPDQGLLTRSCQIQCSAGSSGITPPVNGGSSGGTPPVYDPPAVKLSPVYYNASSVFDGSSVGITKTYEPWNIYDNDMLTSWMPDRGNWRNSTIYFGFDNPVEIEYIKVMPGLNRPGDYWVENNRLRRAQFSFDSGSPVTAWFDDDNRMQRVDINTTTYSVTMTVLEVYSGSRFSGDLCLSELEIWGHYR